MPVVMALPVKDRSAVHITILYSSSYGVSIEIQVCSRYMRNTIKEKKAIIPHLIGTHSLSECDTYDCNNGFGENQVV